MSSHMLHYLIIIINIVSSCNCCLLLSICLYDLSLLFNFIRLIKCNIFCKVNENNILMFIHSTVLPLLIDTVSCVIKFSRQSLWLTIFLIINQKLITCTYGKAINIRTIAVRERRVLNIIEQDLRTKHNEFL